MMKSKAIFCTFFFVTTVGHAGLLKLIKDLKKGPSVSALSRTASSAALQASDKTVQMIDGDQPIRFIGTSRTATSVVSQAPDKMVKMPDAETLRARLNNNKFSIFADHTKMVDDLAGKQAKLGAIMGAVTLSHGELREHLETLEDGDATQQKLQARQSALFYVLLQDSPAALEDLQKRGWYDPAKSEQE